MAGKDKGKHWLSYLTLETQTLRDREEDKKTVDKGNRFRKNI